MFGVPAMAPLRASLFLFLLLLLLLPFTSGEEGFDRHSHDRHHPIPAACQDDLALLKELDVAQSHVHDLERSLSEKDLALQKNEERVKGLQSEIESLKEKETLQYDTVLKELASKVSRLEDELGKAELELQASKVKAKTLEASQSLHSNKIKELEKLVSEQKAKIVKAERALRAAEATLLRVQDEVAAKDKELLKVHGGWLPPWTSIKLSEIQESASKQWTKHGQPLIDTTMKKASKKLSQARKWSKPYVDDLKSKCGPVLKQSMETVSATVSPHLETVKSKVKEGYQSSKDFILPYLERVQDAVRPNIQVAKDTCKPYVEEVAAFVQPHVKQLQSVTRPYTDKIAQGYRKFLTSATNYHTQLQKSMKGKMEKVDFLAPLASSELVWFLSAALLVLPIIMTYLFFSSALGPSKKPAKAGKSHQHHGHGHKKAKRVKQADK